MGKIQGVGAVVDEARDPLHPGANQSGQNPQNQRLARLGTLKARPLPLHAWFQIPVRSDVPRIDAEKSLSFFLLRTCPVCGLLVFFGRTKDEVRLGWTGKLGSKRR